MKMETKTPRRVLDANKEYFVRNKEKVLKKRKEWAVKRRNDILLRYGPCVCGSMLDVSLCRIDPTPKLKGPDLDAWLVSNGYPSGAIYVRCKKCVKAGKFRMSGKEKKARRLKLLGKDAVKAEQKASWAKNAGSNSYRHRVWCADKKLEALNGYGGPVCSICGDSRFYALELDHADGYGNKHRKELKEKGEYGVGLYSWVVHNGFPLGFRVLCSTCNIREHYAISGKSPHPIKVEAIKRLGGACTRCGTTDARVIALHHTKNDGKEQRKISNNTGGWVYLRKVIDKLHEVGLECLCYSCHRVRHAEESNRPLPSSFNDSSNVVDDRLQLVLKTEEPAL